METQQWNQKADAEVGHCNFFQRTKREPERSVGFILILIHLVSCHILSLPRSLVTSVILLALLKRTSEREPERIKDSHMTQTNDIWMCKSQQQ